MLASLAKPVTMISNVSHPPTACVDLFVVRSVEDSCFVICMGGASRDPIRECSDRGLIAVLYCGSHRVRMLTQLSSRNFLSTLRRATSSPRRVIGLRRRAPPSSFSASATWQRCLSIRGSSYLSPIGTGIGMIPIRTTARCRWCRSYVCFTGSLI